MANTPKQGGEDEVAAILAQAAQQYEAYLEIAKLGEFTAALATETTWVHNPNAPLSLELQGGE